MTDSAKDERKSKMRSIAATISKMTPEQRAEFAARMPAIVTIEGRALSVFNCCMLATQCPTATVVGGFRQWIKSGRVVRKGEHGYAIWVPMGPRKAAEGASEDQSDETRFMLGTVFDVAQTDEIATAREAA
jgi:antirestriction protein ArdC